MIGTNRALRSEMRRDDCGPYTPNVSMATGTNKWDRESAGYLAIFLTSAACEFFKWCVGATVSGHVKSHIKHLPCDHDDNNMWGFAIASHEAQGLEASSAAGTFALRKALAMMSLMAVWRDRRPRPLRHDNPCKPVKSLLVTFTPQTHIGDFYSTDTNSLE